MILGITIATLTLATDLYTDVRLWKQGKPVNHKRGALLRLIGLVPAVWFAGLICLPLFGFAYWFLFDGLYNHFRKLPFWYTGSIDPDDAKTDIFLRRLKPWQHKALKIGGLVASLLLLTV